MFTFNEDDTYLGAVSIEDDIKLFAYRRGYYTGYEVGYNRGYVIGCSKLKDKEAIKIAKRMLKDNWSVEKVQKYTKLPIEKVKQLVKKENN